MHTLPTHPPPLLHPHPKTPHPKTYRKQRECQCDDILTGAKQAQVGCNLGEYDIQHHEVVLETYSLLQSGIYLGACVWYILVV